tara:strand:+ start:194 stop:637 length:444 start_codon:yes stop_codon:yes gene_type:complete
MEYVICYHCGKHVHKPMDAPLSVEETINRIEDAVCDYYNVTMDMVRMKCRKRHIVEPRQVMMYLIKLSTNKTLEHIGEHLGGKDHTTVLHGCRTILNLVETQHNMREYIKSTISYLSLTPHDKSLVHSELFKGIISKKVDKALSLAV